MDDARARADKLFARQLAHYAPVFAFIVLGVFAGMAALFTGHFRSEDPISSAEFFEGLFACVALLYGGGSFVLGIIQTTSTLAQQIVAEDACRFQARQTAIAEESLAILKAGLTEKDPVLFQLRLWPGAKD